MYKEELEEISNGEKCPNCRKHLGPLSRYQEPIGDYRLRCTHCRKRFTPNKFKIDKIVILYFAKMYSVHSASNKIGCAYNTVYSRYNKLRTLIKIHSDSHNIPKLPPISEIRKIKRTDPDHALYDNLMSYFWNKPNISDNRLPLYQREFEFRLYYKNTDIEEIVTGLFLNGPNCLF